MHAAYPCLIHWRVRAQATGIRSAIERRHHNLLLRVCLLLPSVLLQNFSLKIEDQIYSKNRIPDLKISFFSKGCNKKQ